MNLFHLASAAMSLRIVELTWVSLQAAGGILPSQGCVYSRVMAGMLPFRANRNKIWDGWLPRMCAFLSIGCRGE